MTGSIKFLHYLLSISLLSILFIACSDETDIHISDSVVPDGYLQLDFVIPEADHIRTRTEKEDEPDERAINELSVFIFDENGTTLLQREDFDVRDIEDLNRQDNEENRFSVTFRLETAVEDYIKPQIYVLANCGAETGEYRPGKGKSAEDLKELFSASYKNDGGYFTMSGKTNIISRGRSNISLMRNAAKISIRYNSTDRKFVLTGFKIYNTADECYLTSSIEGSRYRELLSDHPLEGSYNSVAQRYETYLNPTKAFDGEGSSRKVSSFVVVSGEYEGQPCYYRLDICSHKDNPGPGESRYSYYNVEPNHWYEMVIESVNDKGAESEGTAIARGHSALLSLDIRDHTGEILSMVSDGQRELGVENIVTTTLPSGSFRIKCFDHEGIYPKEPSIGNNGESDLKVWVDPSDESYVIINGFSEVMPVPEVGENIGKQWNVDFTISGSGPRTVLIHVSWFGLTRDIIINYIAEEEEIEVADGSKLFSWQYLIMHDSSKSTDREGQQSNYTLSRATDGTRQNIVVTDYFYWLKNERGMEGNILIYNNWVEKYKIFGVSEEDMGKGNARDNGFHFPVNYKRLYDDDWKKISNPTPWWYEYYLLLDWDAVAETNIIIDFEHKNGIWQNLHLYDSSGKNIEEKIISKGTYFMLILGKQSEYDSDYYDGFDDGYDSSINYLRIKDSNGNILYRVPMYHKGFFNLEEGSHRQDSYEKGFYYYEVETIGGKHWLDRNLGATSRGMWSTAGNERTGLFFNEGSNGGYFSSTPYCYSCSNSNLGNNVCPDLCPPGYRIATESEFNDLMGNFNLSGSWVTANSGLRIYMPFAGYMQSRSMTGEPGKGYYWTSTAGTLTPSAKWLKALIVDKNGYGFENMNIDSEALSIRCVAVE